jgi:hypothetical protein
MKCVLGNSFSSQRHVCHCQTTHTHVLANYLHEKKCILRGAACQEITGVGTMKKFKAKVNPCGQPIIDHSQSGQGRMAA